MTYAKVPLGHYTVVTIWWFSLLQAHFTVHLRFQLPTEFRSRSCVIFPYLKTRSVKLLSYQNSSVLATVTGTVPSLFFHRILIFKKTVLHFCLHFQEIPDM